MRVCDVIECSGVPCPDVDRSAYLVPDVDVDPGAVSIILVSECSPPDPADGYHGPGDPLFARTTVAAFNDAGVAVSSVADILARGVYLTTAVKCAKTGSAIDPGTIRACSGLLEREMGLFPNARVLLLMGDVAIRAVNEIAKRAGEPRVVPAGATYRIRGGEFRFRGLRVLPSYLQAGPAFFIEKSKRRMIAEDIARAFEIAAGG